MFLPFQGGISRCHANFYLGVVQPNWFLVMFFESKELSGKKWCGLISVDIGWLPVSRPKHSDGISHQQKITKNIRMCFEWMWLTILFRRFLFQHVFHRIALFSCGKNAINPDQTLIRCWVQTSPAFPRKSVSRNSHGPLSLVHVSWHYG